jgi:hypothetical protein
MSVTVEALDPATDCHRPAASHDAAPVVEPYEGYAKQAREWVAFDLKWETKICKDRGRYVWKGGRFVRGR